MHPGDLIVGDADGVGVIESEKASGLLALADRKVADEAARLEAIVRSETSARWLVPALRAAGMLGADETL